MQSDSGKLFIGGISWDTDEDCLKDHFSKYGEVVEAIIMKDRNTGRARGFGFVVFADPAVAERVIQEKHNIGGRMVEAKKAVPRDDQNILIRSSSSSIQGSPGPGRTRKIFVGGLASSVTETEFRAHFEQFGTITDVVVMYDHNTQRPRGFGFITYDSEEAVDKAMLKTFHELNGKMVEVKRAVPKELSPSPSRAMLGGYNYGMSRVNSFLNGYNAGGIGGYGHRMDGRFSPVAGTRTAFAPFGAGYGMGVNFEPGVNAGFVGNANFASNVSYGRGVSPYFIGNTANRFGNAVGFEGNNTGNTSFFSSVTRNLLGNGALNYNNPNYNTPNTAGSGNFTRSGSGNVFGSVGNNVVNWDGPSQISAQSGGNNFPNNNMNFRYSDDDFVYARNNGINSNPLSYSTANAGGSGDYDASVLTDLYAGGTVFGDWRSSTPEKENVSGSFGGYGINGGTSDVSGKSSPGVVGSYSGNRRQPNRGIAA